MTRAQNAARAALGVVILVCGLLLSLVLPPSFFSSPGASVATTLDYPPSFLAVSVYAQNSSGLYSPVKGDSVGVTQISAHGIHIGLVTNGTGAVEIPAFAGTYGVSVKDGRFGVQTTVQVFQGSVTELTVTANRSSYAATLAAAQDLTGSGKIEPWETLSLAIQTGVVLTPGGLGVVVISGNFSMYRVLPSLPATVFVQPLRCCVAYSTRLIEGAEVPATLLSQATRGGIQWLDLRPHLPVTLAGVSLFDVSFYSANYSVSHQSV